METVVRVIPYGNLWRVGSEPRDSLYEVYRTKAEAVNAAKTLDRDRTPSKLVVQRSDGTVEYERLHPDSSTHPTPKHETTHLSLRT